MMNPERKDSYWTAWVTLAETRQRFWNYKMSLATASAQILFARIIHVASAAYFNEIKSCVSDAQREMQDLNLGTPYYNVRLSLAKANLPLKPNC
jgi:hypothetical protein